MRPVIKCLTTFDLFLLLTVVKQLLL